MHVKSSANMNRAELEDGEMSFFLHMCRGWRGVKVVGTRPVPRDEESPKLILNIS